MQTGAKISGAAHVGLILIVLFWGTFTAKPLPMEVAQVSLISAEEYAALSETPQAPVVSESPPQVPEPPEETAAPEPAPQPEPEPAPAPDVVEQPDTAPQPEAPPVPQPDPPAAEVAETPAPEPAPVEAPQVTEAEPQPRPIERVAPEVVAAPPPDVRNDEETREEVAEEQGAETPQEAQDATAPEEATDRITPETQEVAALAPSRSVRPPARIPQPPASRPEPTPVAESRPAPETPREEARREETPPAETRDAVNDALAQALGDAQEVAPEPAGPPLSAGEKDALRVAVSQCWNVGSLSSAALNTTVVVSVAMQQDGRPDTGSIRMLSSSGGDSNSARQAFEAARRAIIRCGGSGFDLPAEKYAHWRDIEMTFNPERMRIR